MLPQHAVRVDFNAVNRAALATLLALLRRWLPDGKAEGPEYVARNPCRSDRRPGSFKINLHSGRWADFATGDSGGDVVSLAAYLAGLSQTEAARALAGALLRLRQQVQHLYPDWEGVLRWEDDMGT